MLTGLLFGTQQYLHCLQQLRIPPLKHPGAH